MRQYWQGFPLQTGSTQQSFVQWYKPGGTLMFSVGNLTGRVVEQHQDHMGRWVSQTLKGFSGKQVTIVSAYQAVTDRQHTGLMTVPSQQRNTLAQLEDPPDTNSDGTRRRDHISKQLQRNHRCGVQWAGKICRGFPPG